MNDAFRSILGAAADPYANHQMRSMLEQCRIQDLMRQTPSGQQIAASKKAPEIENAVLLLLSDD